MSKPEFETLAREAEQLRDEALSSYENAGTTREQSHILVEPKAALNRR